MAGGREETVDDLEILLVFYRSDDPVLFTGEVAEAISFSNQGTLPRLKKLADSGLLKSKSGGKVPVWWLSDEGMELVTESLDG
ncbi:hypothetical protein C440_12704 [Haloferax mucosum ATCC BAA-1512]|uniref:Uncharacterized protein n=1 Tax=Haloferax mucosum ATCC BAA-1512 TaxID=662479 RepID=M0I838_9EURY|nr:hypothetical protein [Haloferax mucosum]ELZ92980.1 hypothetical protein C440_12704 [Haloferax mucosum ATCC BAA-1512]